MIPELLLEVVSAGDLPGVEALFEALSPPESACVGVEVAEMSGVIERTMWWRNLDPSGRPVVGASLEENERGRFDDLSTWTRKGRTEIREDREGPDLVRVTRTTRSKDGLPVRIVRDRDEGYGPNRLTTTFRYDDGAILQVDDYREGPMRKRTTTTTALDADGRPVRHTVSVEEGREEVPGCTSSLARDGAVETWTVDCADGSDPQTLAWTRDPAGRVTALHREAPFVGAVDVRYVRDLDGTLLGSVETGETHRFVRAFTAGCGEEPRPEAGDVR